MTRWHALTPVDGRPVRGSGLAFESAGKGVGAFSASAPALSSESFPQPAPVTRINPVTPKRSAVRARGITGTTLNPFGPVVHPADGGTDPTDPGESLVRMTGMREVWTLVGVVAVLAVAAAGCSGGGGSNPEPDAGVAGFQDPQAGLSARIPADWNVIRRRPEGSGKSRLDLKGAPVDAAVGGGSLWVLTRSGRGRPGHLVRVGLRSGRMLSSRRIRGPQAVAFGQGSVWVAEFRRNRVLRFASRGRQRPAAIRLSLPRPVGQGPDRRGFFPFDIAAGEGAIWVATARGSVAEIDPDCNCVVHQIPIPFESLATIAVGEGAVWVAGDLDGMIRIDPESREKIRIPIEDSGGRRLQVGSIRAAEHRVWATGSWTAPVGSAAGTDGPGSFVAGDEAAIVELGPGGKVFGKTHSPPGTSMAPGTGGPIWVSRWNAREIFLLDPSPPGLHRLWRLLDPAHLLATRGRTLWIVQAGNLLVRRVYQGPGREKHPDGT